MTTDSSRATRRLRALSLGLLTLTWLGGLATAAHAQGEEPATSHRIGSFYVAPMVTLRDFGVDSNVYNTPEAVSDFTFTLRPSIEAGTRRRRASLTLHSVTDLVYYARQTSERSVNEDVGASGRVDLRHLFLTGAGSYQNTRQRPNEEIDARSRRVQRMGQAGIGIAFTPKLSVQLIGRHARTIYDADAVFENTSLAQKLNRDVRTLVGAVRYNVTPLTTIVLTQDVERTEFRRAPERDSRSRQTLLGVELNPRALISGSVTLGFQRLRPDDPLTPPFDGLVGSADVTYRFRRSTIVRAGFDRRLDYSYSNHEPYYVRDGYRVGLRRQVSERLDVELGGGRYWHRYRSLLTAPDATPAPAGAHHTADIHHADASVGYRLRRGTRLVIGVVYRDRIEPSERGYTSLGMVSAVSYAF